MSKINEQAREIVRYITRGRGGEVLVVVPNIGAVGSISSAILATCDSIGLDQYRVHPANHAISFDNGARINFQSLYPDTGKPEVEPQLFRLHREAAKAVAHYMSQNPNVEIVAVAHEQGLARHAFGELCGIAVDADLRPNFRESDLQMVLENGARIRFHAAGYVAEGMLAGRRFDAYWMLAPYLWKQREAFQELDARMREDVRAKFESFR